jgi:hypothetical protein
MWERGRHLVVKLPAGDSLNMFVFDLAPRKESECFEISEVALRGHPFGVNPLGRDPRSLVDTPAVRGLDCAPRKPPDRLETCSPLQGQSDFPICLLSHCRSI